MACCGVGCRWAGRFRWPLRAGHDIEAQTPPSAGAFWLRDEPGTGAAAQALLLAPVDRFGGASVSVRAPRLDLDDDQERAAPSDEVDLDAIRTDVVRDDAIPSRLEKIGGEGFAFTTEALFRIGPLRCVRFSRRRAGDSFRSARWGWLIRGHAFVFRIGSQGGASKVDDGHALHRGDTDW